MRASMGLLSHNPSDVAKARLRSWHEWRLPSSSIWGLTTTI